MSGNDQLMEREEPLFVRPGVGTFLTVLSGLSFLFVCMILPLVGKAAYLTDRYPKNRFWFTVALIVAIALSALATVSKLQRRKIDQSPLPMFSLAILSMSGLLLVALMLGLLHI